MSETRDERLDQIDNRIATIQGHLVTEINKRQDLSDKVRNLDFTVSGMGRFIELQSDNIVALQEQNSELKRRVAALEDAIKAIGSHPNLS